MHPQVINFTMLWNIFSHLSFLHFSLPSVQAHVAWLLRPTSSRHPHNPFCVHPATQVEYSKSEPITLAHILPMAAHHTLNKNAKSFQWLPRPYMIWPRLHLLRCSIYTSLFFLRRGEHTPTPGPFPGTWTSHFLDGCVAPSSVSFRPAQVASSDHSV